MAKKTKPRRRPTQKRANQSNTKPQRPGHITNAQRQRAKRQQKELARAVDSVQHRVHLLNTGQITLEGFYMLTALASRPGKAGHAA